MYAFLPFRFTLPIKRKVCLVPRAQQGGSVVSMLAVESEDPRSNLRWKERTDFHKLSSDLLKVCCGIHAYTHHTHRETHTCICIHTCNERIT